MFMLGGTTYEEGRAVALLNQKLANEAAGGPGGTRILLGGSTVHNSTRYVYKLPTPVRVQYNPSETALSGDTRLAYRTDSSFLDMVTSCAEHFPTDIYGPPIASAAPSAPSPTTSQPNGSGISLRAGGYELSVGGTAGSGLYRSTQGDVAASFQLPPGATQVAEGIRDGAGRLWGNVRQKVEERVSRTGTPQGR